MKNELLTIGPFTVYGYGPVSYTHLDVYKRQPLRSAEASCEGYVCKSRA